MEVFQTLRKSIFITIVLKSVILLTLFSVLKDLVQEPSRNTSNSRKLGTRNPPQIQQNVPMLFDVNKFQNPSLSRSLKYYSLYHFEELKFDSPISMAQQSEKKDLKNKCKVKDGAPILLIVSTASGKEQDYTNLVRALKETHSLEKSEPVLTSFERPFDNSGFKCVDFQIFVLTPRNDDPLFVQAQLNTLAKEVHMTVSYLAQRTSKIDIFSYDLGSIVVYQWLAECQIDTKSLNTISKVDKIIMIDPFDPSYEPVAGASVSRIVTNIKHSILSHKSRLSVFNSLKFITIYTSSRVTGNEDQFQMVFSPPLNSTDQSEKSNSSKSKFTSLRMLRFHQSHFYSTYEMHGVQQYLLPEQSFLQSGKFLHKVSQLIVHCTQYLDTPSKEIKYILLYGQISSGPQSQIAQMPLYREIYENCFSYQLETSMEPIIWKFKQKCLRLSIKNSIKEEIYFIYSELKKKGRPEKIDVYGAQNLQKIQPYYQDEYGNEVYIFDRFLEDIFINNDMSLILSIGVGKIFTPLYPLTQFFSEKQILYMGEQSSKTHSSEKILTLPKPSQEPTKDLVVVRMCETGQYRLFPDQFPVGGLNRRFLLEESQKKCYGSGANYQSQLFFSSIGEQSVHNISSISHIFKTRSILLSNTALFMLTFCLCLSQTSRKDDSTSSQSSVHDYYVFILTLSLLLNYLNETELPLWTIFCLVSVSFLVECSVKGLSMLSYKIQIGRRRVFYCMMLIFVVIKVAEALGHGQYNSWKVFFIFSLFFFNEQNGVITVFKLYFLFPEIANGTDEFKQIIQLSLYFEATMYEEAKVECIESSRTTSKGLEPRGENFKKTQLMMDKVFAASVALHLCFWGEDFTSEYLLDIYLMIVIVVCFIENKLRT